MYNKSIINSEQKPIRLPTIIGMVTEVRNSDDGPYFYSVHSFCYELHQYMASFKEETLFCVFSLSSVQDDCVDAFIFNSEADQWEQQTLPLPNVIYNRIHSRKTERSKRFKQFLQQLELNHIPIFNQQFLSKLDVHTLLANELQLQPFLPQTLPFSRDNLQQYIDTFPIVFLKPINGSQGRNILKLLREKDVFVLNDSSRAHITEKTFTTFDSLCEYLKSRFGKRRYLIQQGIDLIQQKNRHLDFRILCHKNAQQLWKVSSSVARLSAEHKFVANLAQGGDSLRPLKALNNFFDRSFSKSLHFLMKEISIETANIISQYAGGHIGELGIDIGIDHNGQPWIIEVNSKPSKNLDTETNKIRPSARAIAEYAYTLANLNEEDK